MIHAHYQINGDPENGYGWLFIGPDGNVEAYSETFRAKADCLRSLRTTQHNAATRQIIDRSA